MNLYKQNETLGITFFQVPMALFASKKYSNMSLQAKVTYGLMLNRMQLSSLNGWVNENKEVYIIYTRDQMAQQLNLSYKSIVAVFKELKQYGLIEEQRRGNGLPNHIYLYKVEIADQDAEDYCDDSGCEEMTGQATPKESETSGQDHNPVDRYEESTGPDLSKGQVMTCKNERSGCVDSTGLDVQNLHPSYIDFSYKDFNKTDMSYIESSQSVCQALETILAKCDFAQFPEDEAPVLQEAVCRLYHIHNFKISGAVLPQEQVRAQLEKLDGEVLKAAYDKIRANARPVKNSLGYIMAVIYNTIAEVQGDLMTDPYLNFLYNNKSGGNTCAHKT